MSLETSVEVLPSCLAVALEESSPEQSWLLNGLWTEQGVGVIGGAPKSYKSWMALEMAVSISAGIPCLDRFAVTAPGPTLVFFAEDALADVRKRITAICKARGLDLAALPLHVITAPMLRLDVEDDFRLLVETIKQLKPRLLVLDPFVRLHSADENRAGEIAAILGRLRGIQRALNVAILIVHHARKVTSGLSPGQALRGSTDFHAWVDCLIFLERGRHGLKVKLEHRSAPASDPFFIELDQVTPHLKVVEGAHAPNAPALEERVIAKLACAPEPMTRKALRDCLAVNNQRLGDALKRLESQGMIRHAPNGWLR